MQNRPKSKMRLEYRQYNLDPEYPVKALLLGRFIFPKAQLDAIHYMHLHNCVELGYNYAGSNTLVVEEEAERITRPGDVTVICPFAMHASYSTPEQIKQENLWEYLYVDPGQLFRDFYPGGFPEQEKFAHYCAHFPTLLTREKFPELTALLRSIFEEMRGERAHYKQVVKAKLLTFFLELGRAISLKVTPTVRHSQILAVSPAIACINDHYPQHIPPECLAELCHMSPTHFRRTFKAIMGQTPVEYIMGVRIHNSCRLLYETELSILEIAMRVGYNSISSFNRNFSEIMSTTPSKWRNETRQIQKKDLVYTIFKG